MKYEVFCDQCGCKVMVENPDENACYLCKDCVEDWERAQELQHLFGDIPCDKCG